MATYRSIQPVPTDIITYRFAEKLVYVRPADNYEQALDVAQKEFPEELGDIPRDRITFNIVANINGGRKHVRISDSAWIATVARLLRGEIIELHIRPDTSEKDAPPLYLEVPVINDGEDKPLQNSRAAPSSRASLRTRQSSPAPSPKSHKSKGLFGSRYRS
ncbi:hypothetical protein BDQ17DRAFT_704566 [Cyathus striatus]|nr:hypothetical protein BDQ17DRAFT_704566 [Cyathus striatus]